MKHLLLVLVIVLQLLCTFGASRVFAVPELDTSFSAADIANWQLRRVVPTITSLTFPAANETPGIRFKSVGMDLLTHNWLIGTQPFEMSADVLITKGLTEDFARDRGVVITLSSAPVDRMQASDLAVIFVITQEGPIATVKLGGARYGTEIRPNVWQFPGDEVTPRFVTTMGGAGGHTFSIRWPTNILDGTIVRFWAARTADGVVHFKIFNADGVAAPWWEGQLSLPANAQNASLQLFTIQTGRQEGDFVNLQNFFLNSGQGNSPLDGVVQRLRARSLNAGDKTVLDEPFPAAVLAPPTGWQPHSVLLPAEELTTLRAKFNDPVFANYKTIILRCASAETLDKIGYASTAQHQAALALLWAYVLTQDKATYLERLLTAIDGLSNVSDKFPAQEWDYPGHMRQILNIRTFYIPNMTVLALAYDLLGKELDTTRRDHIRYLLVRAMNSYHALLDVGDWWFGINPSNTIGVGNGCVGIIAVVLKDEQPELATKTISRAVNNIKTLFLGVDVDGGSIEGNLYWQYGLTYPLLFGWALHQATGTDQALYACPQIQNADRYLAVNFGGDGKNIPFNDTQPWLTGWPICAAGGSEFNKPLLRWMADTIAKNFAEGTAFPEQSSSEYTIPAFLYRDRIPAPKTFPGLPTLATLDSVQEGAMRADGSQFIPAMLTGVKGKGHNTTHHAEQDQGSFVLYTDGQMMLFDPGYFEDGPECHTLPLLGKDMALDPRAYCPLSDAWEQGDMRTLTVDATSAYNSGVNTSNPLATKVRRVLVQLADQTLIVLDEVQPRVPTTTITAQYQLGVPVKLAGVSAVLQGDKGDVTLQTFGPQLAFKVTPREFSQDWVYKKSGVKWSTLSSEYHTNGQPLVSVLSRVSKDAPAPKVVVVYGNDAINVTIAGNKPVIFRLSELGYKVVKE